MVRLSDKDFASAVRNHVAAHGPDHIKKIEDAIRAEGYSASSKRVVDVASDRNSGMLVAKCGRGQKVYLKESLNGKAAEPEAAAEATPPTQAPRNRMAEFGEALARLAGSLPPGCKISLTIGLNEEMPF